MWGTLATANTYRYSSKEIDPQSGIYYYGYRYYEPNLQRWLNQDPIGEEGGLNLYGYVRNNPIKWTDPLGLEIRLYANPAFGNSALTHEFFWSTDENEGVGENGSSGSAIGNGVPSQFDPNSTSDPYVTIDTYGLTDADFLDLVANDPKLNSGLYVPFVNDCHKSAQATYFDATGYNLNDPFPRVNSWSGAIGSLVGGILDSLPNLDGLLD
jgi:RHS repeat-associated protein